VFKQASNDALVVYLVLRHDAVVCQTSEAKSLKASGVLGSGFCLDDVASFAGIPSVTAARCLEELIKRRWVKKADVGYLLGDAESGWLLDVSLDNTPVDTLGVPKVLASSERFNRKLAEDKSRRASKLTHDTKRHIVSRTVGTDDVKSREVLKSYASRYRSMFSADPPMLEEGLRDTGFAKAYVYIGRAAKWAGSRTVLIEVIEFTFDNWEELKSALRLDGRPTLNMFGSAKIFPRLLSAKSDGIPKRKPKFDRSSVTDRVDQDAEKDSGW